MSYRNAVTGLVVLLAGAAVCTAARAERQTPQWSVTFDNANGQFAISVVVGTRATSDGITINLLRSAASLTPAGVRQWRVDPFDACPPGTTNGYIDAVERLPTGESWVLRSCYAPGGLPQRHELVRLAADGGVLMTTDLGATPALWSRAMLIAQSGGVIALVPHNDGLRWLRIGTGGDVIDDAFTELVGPDDTVIIANARLWPNGSASVATWQRVADCNISPPTACARPASTLLRLNTDGSERWRVEAGAVLAFVGFDEDGSSLIAETRITVPLRLRQVSATGVLGTAFVAAGGEPIYLTGAAGPVRGRYLAYSETEHLLIDRHGTVLARRSAAGDAGGAAMANGEMGFITGAWQSDGALISADDLSVLAEFDVDGIEGALWDGPGNKFWSLLDDGTIYTNSRIQGDTLQRARISRFAVPGTPAADLVFVDHFE
jgi:hypothetical protein